MALVAPWSRAWHAHMQFLEWSFLEPWHGDWHTCCSHSRPSSFTCLHPETCGFQRPCEQSCGIKLTFSLPAQADLTTSELHHLESKGHREDHKSLDLHQNSTIPHTVPSDVTELSGIFHITNTSLEISSCFSKSFPRTHFLLGYPFLGFTIP
jgi:hypothetical protein